MHQKEVAGRQREAEVEEMKQRLGEAEARLAEVGEAIEKNKLNEELEKVRTLYEIAKDLGEQIYPEGDEDFEKIVLDGEEALTWIEDAAVAKAE